MKKYLKTISISFLLVTGSLTSKSQSLPIGFPLLEESYRTLQLKGERDSSVSFTIRPIQGPGVWGSNVDSVRHKRDACARCSFKLLPVLLEQQYNSHHPYGWNDGSMIPARGYQNRISAGMFARYGGLSIQLRPEFVYAQNKNFPGFPAAHTDSIWYRYYHQQNWIDNPEKFGNSAYAKLFPGQSSIRYNYRKLSLGVSTENLWWGPGVRNALVMSNNAPGFAHLTFNSNSPLKSRIGSFEWQVIAGTLKNSGILPPDTGRTFEGSQLYYPKHESDRYINAMIVTWQPKWVRGLYLGMTRSFFQYKDNIPRSINGYLPIVTAFFKSNSKDENSFGRDQLLSMFFRWMFVKEQAEIYAEFGRNDHSQNFNDLLLEPEHSRAYIIGLKKIFTNRKNTDVEFLFEIANLQTPSTGLLRDIPSWYLHHQIRHGYTNRGQVLGAGIGTGSNSQTVGINWIKGISKFGLSIERIVRNNDFYYSAFTAMRNSGSHWVDMSLNANKTWLCKRLLYSANLSLVRSFNYQWGYDANPATLLNGKKNVNNIHTGLSVAYLF